MIEDEDSLIRLYKEQFQLQKAQFALIDHEDAMVATVFKVTQRERAPMILKICSRPGDYAREVFFLHHFASLLPVARLIGHVPPKADFDGAILMECFSGSALKREEISKETSYTAGALLARIHLDPVKGYGDLTEPELLSDDPRIPFTAKFEEGLEECRGHLPAFLIEKCRSYFDRHVNQLLEMDGPRIVHRDFRPGNLIIDHGKLQGVIDWSSARGGFAEEDFSPLELGEWLYKGPFLAGYASLRKIPDYNRAMPLLRLSRALGAIGFTVKRNIWQDKGAKMYQLNLRYLESFLLD